MAGRDERKTYLRAEDMTPDFLAGISEGTTVPHREILDFVERITFPYMDSKPSGAIMRRVHMTKKTRRASIVGFADRSINLRGDQIREVMIEPFHIKNKAMHKAGDAGFSLAAGGEPQLDQMTATMAVDALETARLNLVVEAFCAMVDAKQFRYVDDQDMIITIPYGADIADMPDAGSFPASTGDFSNANCNALVEVRGAKAAYRNQQGIDFPFALAFINPTTAGMMLKNASIKAIYQPIQPSDPDRTAETYDGFVFDGVQWIVLHKSYATPDGEQPAIADGYAVVTVPQHPRTGRRPMQWLSCETIFNRQNAEEPYYDTLVEGNDPPEIGPRVYDNGIPAPSERGIIARWKLYTA